VLAGVPGVLDVQVFGDRLHVQVTDAAATGPLISAALAAESMVLSSLQQVEPGLEDVFVSLLHG